MRREVRADARGLATLRAAVDAVLAGAPVEPFLLDVPRPAAALSAAAHAAWPVPDRPVRCRVPRPGQRHLPRTWLATSLDWRGQHRVETVPPQARTAGTTGGARGVGDLPEGLDPESARTMALVELAQGGDREAFGQLYDRYADTVYRYIYYKVGKQRQACAEDLTSETFLRALRRISTFTWQGRDFGAWLVTIARNLVADHFKSSRFRLEVTTDDVGEADTVAPSPEEAVLDRHSTDVLLAAVRRLNPQQRECVTLRFLQGLSVAETARIMEKNEGAIKTLQYRAVRTLARLLPEDAR